jgi:1-acyl-sn-glycerol-3-phosphate acyltransferase
MQIVSLLVYLIRLIVGAYPRWQGCKPSRKQRIYFANHTSHMDALVIWAAFPKDIRDSVRTVAAKDYWDKNAIRRRIATKELRAVLVDREARSKDPLAPMSEVLKNGESLVIFPEGTRSEQKLPNSFKAGLYKLATDFPSAELIPVYLENLNRSLPKGRYIPVPIASAVRFGAPLERIENESKEDFLVRARLAVEELA